MAIKSPKSAKPYYRQEFKAFIKAIKEDNIKNWTILAEALGVSRDTVIDWKKLPEAQEAIQEAITHALSEMQKAGGNDWKMWREKLKMLGVIEVQRNEITGPGGGKVEVSVTSYEPTQTNPS